MKRRIKPFTLFLLIFIVAYLVLGTKIFLLDTNKNQQSQSEDNKQKPVWTGIITLWDIPYVETGIGTNSSWLNTRIREFERNHPGVFIDVRKMTPQRTEMYLSGNIDTTILPDIISIPPYEDVVPPYLYDDLEILYDNNEFERLNPLAQKRVIKNNIVQGVPTMMGTYALFLNKDMLEKREIVLDDSEMNFRILDNIVENLPYVKKERKKDIYYYGFGSYDSTYAKPIASMIYNESGKIQEDIGYRYIHSWLQKQGVVADGIGNTESMDALRLFIDHRRIGVFLGNTRTLYRARAFQSQGKGFEIGVYDIPIEGKKALFQDQIASYGLIKKDDEIKKDYCIAFLKSLLSDDAQTDLKSIGMFPIVNDIDYIYKDDPEMYELEKNIVKYGYGPDDDFWIANHHDIMEILNVEQGDNQDIME